MSGILTGPYFLAYFHRPDKSVELPGVQVELVANTSAIGTRLERWSPSLVRLLTPRRAGPQANLDDFIAEIGAFGTPALGGSEVD